jgi:hypothetical protein
MIGTGMIGSECGGIDDNESVQVLGNGACSGSGDFLRRAGFGSEGERGNDDL